MGPNWTYFVIIGVLALVLFGGRGRISALMGDMAKGVTAFRKGLKDDESKDEDGEEARTEALSSESETKAESRREDERTGS
jgi:sec-independent protein translocase protein TatA